LVKKRRKIDENRCIYQFKSPVPGDHQRAAVKGRGEELTMALRSGSKRHFTRERARVALNRKTQEKGIL